MSKGDRRHPAAIATRSGPRPLPLASIQLLSSQPIGPEFAVVLFAGKPAGKPPPNGMAEILKMGSHTSLGVSGGLTRIKNSAAFTPPAFKFTESSERTGNSVKHYVVVKRTTSQDAEHESYYPLPGNHLRPGMTADVDGKKLDHYWGVSSQISDLIRRGEQEHLDDARRAYELTYQAVEKAINALAGKRFGPADSPEAARQLATDALEKRLPRQLGTDPSNWDRVLDELLVQSKKRDDERWHALMTDPYKTSDKMILDPVSTTPDTRIGRVPSSKVVNY